jgi:hypothetical protein
MKLLLVELLAPFVFGEVDLVHGANVEKMK